MNNMQIALEITALGMGLVFAAIILIWWMMSLLTSITAEKTHSSKPAEMTPMMDHELKAQAAAVAVAVALSERQNASAHVMPLPPTAIVSAWQLGMRTRQLYQKGPIRRPPEIG